MLKNNDAVDSLLGNLQAKFFLSEQRRDERMGARLLGERWVKITSTNAGQSRNEALLSMPQQPGSFNAGVTRADQRRFYVEPAVFTTLKRGGPQNNFQVEAIVYNGGNLFANGNEALPYKLITFNQR